MALNKLLMSKISPTRISENNKIITDSTEIADSFINYFSNIAQTIIDEHKYEGDGNFSKYLPPSQPNSFCIDPVDGDEICSIISEFNTNKSYGPTSIPNEILHLIKHVISKPLSWIANIGAGGVAVNLFDYHLQGSGLSPLLGELRTPVTLAFSQPSWIGIKLLYFTFL